MNAKTCTFHCAACGSHFSSLFAFDAHRDGVHATGRFCLDPEEVSDPSKKPRLSAHDGLCRLARGGPFVGVSIWAERGSVERAQARFGGVA